MSRALLRVGSMPLLGEGTVSYRTCQPFRASPHPYALRFFAPHFGVR
jgi:hypothetical protein